MYVPWLWIQKLISWNPTQSLSAELAQLTSHLSEAKEEKKNNTIQVEKIEVEIQSLGADVIKKVNAYKFLIVYAPLSTVNHVL